MILQVLANHLGIVTIESELLKEFSGVVPFGFVDALSAKHHLVQLLKSKVVRHLRNL